MNNLFYKVNATAIDDLVTQGAAPQTVMVLALFLAENSNLSTKIVS